MREAVFLVVMFVGIVVSIVGGALWLRHTVCVNTAEVIGVEYEWRLAGGCFYEVDGQWIPSDNYTGFEELGK